MRPSASEFSPVFAIGLVLISVYLLMTGRLDGWQFNLALLGSAVLVVVMRLCCR